VADAPTARAGDFIIGNVVVHVTVTPGLNKRILEEISVLSTFPDSDTAMKGYARLHHKNLMRELYVFHTDREQLDITERFWAGVRGG